jgi:NADPH2:quinone reductase
LQFVDVVVMREFGDPHVLQLEARPAPVPGPSQVVVAVELASITFVETQIRAGRPPNPAMLPGLPVVLGNGVGGRVAEIGAAVDPAVRGKRVITTTGGSGGYAERVAVDADALIEVHHARALADAVALLADGRTAIGLADVARLQPEDTVLVEAAAGGVGSLLVQLAARSAATVVGAVGNDRKVEVVEALGVDLAVDYSSPSWTERVRDEVGAIDVVFDAAGGVVGHDAFGLLANGGRFVPFGMASGAFTEIPEDEVGRRGLTVERFMPRGPDEMRALTQRALEAAVAGWLRPIVGQTFPLARAADAHTAIEARTTIGKTLLVVDPAGPSPVA